MGSTADDDDDDEEYDIPDEIEDVIGNPNVANYNWCSLLEQFLFEEFLRF